MAQYIDKSSLVAEIQRIKESIDLGMDVYECSENVGRYEVCHRLLAFIDTLEMKEIDLENYDKVKGLLSLSFMHFLDANRPEDKMCLSNGECFDIDKAFDELDFAKLFRYMEKYLKIQKGE